MKIRMDDDERPGRTRLNPQTAPQKKYHPRLGWIAAAEENLNRLNRPSRRTKLSPKAQPQRESLPYSPASRQREGIVPRISPKNRQVTMAESAPKASSTTFDRPTNPMAQPISTGTNSR